MQGGDTTTALALSIISIVLALLALLWNILNATLLDRARLAVSIDFGMQMVGGRVGTARTVVAIAATNVGRRPVRLNGLWLAFGHPVRWWMRLVPKRWQSLLPRFIVMNPDEDPRMAAMSTPLPILLGPGESANIYDYEQAGVLEKANEERFTHAYARAFGSTANGHSRRVKIPFP